MSHVTAAIGETGVKELFKGIVENFVFEDADSTSGGAFTAGYDVRLHLVDGSVELTNANTVKISELDIAWERLELSLAINFDPVCTPDGCVTVFGQEICIPQWCIFEGDPDIDVTLDLAPFIRRSEISGEVRPVVKYFVHPDRPADMNYLDAEETPDPDDADSNLANRWQVYLDPVWLDVDLFDFEAIVEELLQGIVDTLLDTVFAGFPDWAKDAILLITGPLIDVIGDALDIGDDFGEWLSDLFNVTFGLGNIILNLLADYFANQNPIINEEDPYPVMEAENGLIPVKIPIAEFSVRINSSEMVVEATVGTSLGV
jgi:hypothetical protein